MPARVREDDGAAMSDPEEYADCRMVRGHPANVRDAARAPAGHADALAASSHPSGVVSEGGGPEYAAMHAPGTESLDASVPPLPVHKPGVNM